jgi:uncharacterized protein (DUF2236 family)
MSSRFAADSVVRRVDAEGALLLGGGRALLMQVAHPKVAQGVADHSDFQSDPLKRLFGTLEMTYTIVFGTDEQAEQMATAIHRVHEGVTGPGYVANDPELLMWVHATLVDTAVRVYTGLMGSLTDEEVEEYYQDSTYVAELLGCPRDAQPEDWPAFKAYVREMVAAVEVSDTSRALAASIFNPTLPWVAAPPIALARFVTVGMLPSPLRAQYGFTWRLSDRIALDVATSLASRVLPLLPRPVRHAPKTLLTA